jgi:hypothetical protein
MPTSIWYHDVLLSPHPSIVACQFAGYEPNSPGVRAILPSKNAD